MFTYLLIQRKAEGKLQEPDLQTSRLTYWANLLFGPLAFTKQLFTGQQTEEKKDNRTKHLDRKLQSYNTRWQKRTTVQHTVTEKDNDSDRKRQSYNTVTRQLRQLTGSGECGFPRCLARFAETKRQSYNTHWQKRTIVQHSHESIKTAYWKRWLSLSKMSRPFRWWLCTCTPPCLTTAGLKTNRWTCHHA